MRWICRTIKDAAPLGVFLLMFVCQPSVAAEKRTADINCDIQKQPCIQKLSDSTVILDITPRPVKAMTNLTFRVELSGPQPARRPFIDLGMPGMKMGPNRVALEVVGPGKYEGRGIIVRCPSGRTVWRATVTVPGKGTTDFIFDVVY